MPANGALISVLASFASASCSDASATRRLFSASSLAWPEMKLLFARSVARSNFDFASFRFARACCVSASLMDGSSLTSVAPRVTRWPSLKRIALMRPATSGRTVIDSSERRLPTAVIVCGSAAVTTLTASTATPGETGAGALACASETAPAPATGGPARC